MLFNIALIMYPKYQVLSYSDNLLSLVLILKGGCAGTRREAALELE